MTKANLEKILKDTCYPKMPQHVYDLMNKEILIEAMQKAVESALKELINTESNIVMRDRINLKNQLK